MDGNHVNLKQNFDKRQYNKIIMEIEDIPKKKQTVKKVIIKIIFQGLYTRFFFLRKKRKQEKNEKYCFKCPKNPDTGFL